MHNQTDEKNSSNFILCTLCSIHSVLHDAVHIEHCISASIAKPHYAPWVHEIHYILKWSTRISSIASNIDRKRREGGRWNEIDDANFHIHTQNSNYIPLFSTSIHYSACSYSCLFSFVFALSCMCFPYEPDYFSFLFRKNDVKVMYNMTMFVRLRMFSHYVLLTLTQFHVESFISFPFGTVSCPMLYFFIVFNFEALVLYACHFQGEMKICANSRTCYSNLELERTIA